LKKKCEKKPSDPISKGLVFGGLGGSSSPESALLKDHRGILRGGFFQSPFAKAQINWPWGLAWMGTITFATSPSPISESIDSGIADSL